MISLLFGILINAQAGPILVGNGAGESEYSLVFAKTQLTEGLKQCRTSLCPVNKEEKNTLTQLELISQKIPRLLFKRDSEMTGLFAVTSDAILVNQDLLWLDSAKSIAFGPKESLGLLLNIEEQMPGAPSINPTLREKILQSYTQKIQSTFFELNSQLFEAILWSPSLLHSEFWLRDSEHHQVDMRLLIQSKIGCSAFETFQLFSPALYSIESPNAHPPKIGDQIHLRLNFSVAWKCQGGRQNLAQGQTLVAATAKTENYFELDPSSLILSIQGQP